MHRDHRVLTLGILAALGTPICAADGVGDNAALTGLIQSATVDMPITTAPASFLLGASGEAVPRLASFRAFSAQAARGFDAKGKVANAVAVELAPALAMKNVTWSDVTRNRLSRAWSRTYLSFATQGKTESAPARSAVGLQSILWAPVMDSVLALVAGVDCTKVAHGDFGKPPPPNPGTKEPLTDKEKELIAACQDLIDARLTKWNQPMVSIGIGRILNSSDGATATTTRDSSARWLTAAYGEDLGAKDEAATDRAGYLVTAHWRSSSQVAATGAEVAGRQRLTGLNLRFGNARFAGIGEYSILRTHAASAEVPDRKRALLGLEYKLDKDLYLTAGVARDTGAEPSRQSVLAKLNWGFGKEPVLLAK